MLSQLLRTRNDRGVTAVFVSIVILLLFGFAAVAIDATGIGYNERRQDQSAADTGALAAVQFAVPVDIGNGACSAFSGLTKSRCNGAAEAMKIANANLDDPLLADWNNTDGTRCATPPAGFTLAPNTDCVAFNSNNQRAWVRIPTIDHPTTLARVIGIQSISVSADAEAGSSLFGGGAVLPFLLPGSAAGSNYNCLKTAPNPNFGPCEDLPSTGNFGSMEFFLYGNEDLGYSAMCSGDTNGRFVANLARGVDHPLGLHPSGVGAGIEEDANCPDFNAEPNIAEGDLGQATGLEQGMLYGGSAYASSSYPGRIESSSGILVRNGGGSTDPAVIDNTPLWTFLTGGGPFSCSSVSDPTSMLTCIADAKTAGSVIFNDNLVDSIRYGWTPTVWESNFSMGSSDYHIKQFLPVYIDTTFYGCNSNECQIMHTPGVIDDGNGFCPNNPPNAQITCGTPGAKQDTLVGVTAYILSQAIVPDNAKTPVPGDDNQRSFNLTD